MGGLDPSPKQQERLYTFPSQSTRRWKKTCSALEVAIHEKHDRIDTDAKKKHVSETLNVWMITDLQRLKRYAHVSESHPGMPHGGSCNFLLKPSQRPW